MCVTANVGESTGGRETKQGAGVVRKWARVTEVVEKLRKVAVVSGRGGSGGVGYGDAERW